MAGGAIDLDSEMETKPSKPTDRAQIGAGAAPAGEHPVRGITRGVTLERFFTTPGIDPYSQVEWDLRSAVISGEDGRVVFEQKNVEVPRPWSQTS